MTRRIRMLGVLVLAAMAFWALSAAAAHAAPKYTPSQYPASLKGSEVIGEELTFAIGPTLKLKCGQMSFEGKINSKAEAEGSSFGTSMSYIECVGELLGTKVPFTMALNGCAPAFSLQEAASGSTKEEGWEYTGGLSFKCPEGQVIGITVFQTLKKHEEGSPICAYTVANQGPIGSVDYKLDEAGTKLTARETVTGVAVTKTFGTLVNCGKTEGTMSITGNVGFEAFNSEGAMLTGTLDP